MANPIDMKIHVFEPKSYDEATVIGQTVVNGTTVVLNIRKMPIDQSQRMIDFLTGVAYALDGTIRKVEHKVLVVSPRSDEITGEINPSDN